ncbi:MAG: HD domain-containing protein [Candidatus Saganbacteria bacterium]|nr:HD domain-containing protein [Candidatus Saganbacteria bacterium]
MAIELVKNISCYIKRTVRPVIALRRLHAQNISIKLYDQNIRKTCDLLKTSTDRDNALGAINTLGSKVVLKALKFWRVSKVNITSPFSPEKIWSNDLYDAIQNILFFTKKPWAYTDEQKKTYYSIWTKFEGFACSARTYKEKNLIVKILFDLEEIHDPGTARHSQQTRDWAVAIGRQMKLKRKELKTLELAAYLHDFGKITISRDILNKRSALTEDEMSQIKNHVLMGCEILEACGFTGDILGPISAHHYIKNYPKDINSDEIPPFAKILAAADSIEAATSGRPYEKGKTLITVLKELRDPKGNYDQEVVDAFEGLLKDAGVLNLIVS